MLLKLYVYSTRIEYGIYLFNLILYISSYSESVYKLIRRNEP